MGALWQGISGGGGGGGAVTIADGADVNSGSTTDAGITTDSPGTISAKLRGLVKIFSDVWDSVNHKLAVEMTLPVGAATSALQITGNTSLSSIDGKLTNPLPVSVASLPLPTGASTSALQTTGNTSLSSIDTKLTDNATATLQGVGNASLAIIAANTVNPIKIGFVSVLNSTTALLGGGGTFTGTAEDVSNFATLSLQILADQAGSAMVEWSTDGVNWDTTTNYLIVAGVTFNITVEVESRFYRMFYTNAGTPQGTFRLQSIYKATTPVSDIHNVSTSINNSMNSMLVTSMEPPPSYYGNTTALVSGASFLSPTYDTRLGVQWLGFSAFSITPLTITFEESIDDINYITVKTFLVEANGSNTGYHCAASRFCRIRALNTGADNPGGASNILFLNEQSSSASEISTILADRSGNTIGSGIFNNDRWLKMSLPSSNAVNTTSTGIVDVIGGQDNSGKIRALSVNNKGVASTADSLTLDMLGLILRELKIHSVLLTQQGLSKQDDPEQLREGFDVLQ